MYGPAGDVCSSRFASCNFCLINNIKKLHTKKKKKRKKKKKKEINQPEYNENIKSRKDAVSRKVPRHPNPSLETEAFPFSQNFLL
jgi:hypothetical protein